ncbi:MAG TPA: hypothetical protein VF395_18780, partial [Polyangiaceae bacterium]
NTANPQTILALVCGGTFPVAKVCTDPMETVKFLSLVSVIRTFTMGAPLFNSPQGFISTLKQQSPIGLMLKTMGLEPISFFAEGEVKKAIATESKVFSLIATGHVKNGKRDTKVRIHAVVDFRAAPPPAMLLMNAATQALKTGPGAAAQALAGPGAGAPSGGLPGAGANGLNSPAVAPGSALPAGATADSDAAFLVPSPGGRIVYFRID